MKKMINTEKLNDRDWEELASAMSEGDSEKGELFKQFIADDELNTSSYWNNIGKMNDRQEIDVENAWNKVSTKIKEESSDSLTRPVKHRISRYSFLKVAASFLFLAGLGATALYLVQTGKLSKKIVVATTGDQKNLEVRLPDGSSVILNRNTTFEYRSVFGRSERNVSLSGEAYFDISGDPSKPFIIDAGTARVKVVGTSFNVITNNSGSSVEVFVKTGRVLLTDNSGNQNIMLDPGYVGIMDPSLPEKSLNDNPNYMAWNTGILKFDGQTLDIVFRDMKRVYNVEIVADDPSILTETWTFRPIDNEPFDTIIRLICGSFNLSFAKDGNIYHLSKK